MSYKPNEAAWMAYLYGEADSEEKNRMEVYLAENADAREELANYQALQKMIRMVEDKEVIASPIIVGDEKRRSLWAYPYAKTILSIAASLLIIMVVGRITNTTVSTDANGLHISFGEVIAAPATMSQPQLTPQEVQEMINRSLSTNNTAWEASLNENKKQVDETVRKNLAANNGNTKRMNELVQQVAAASQEQVQGYVASLQSENMKLMQNYMQLTSTEQKDYMENLLVDFTKYLQQQRNDDLKLLQTKITSMEQNTNLLKVETQQILSSLINNGKLNYQKSGTAN